MVPGQFRRAAGPFSWLVLYCIGPRLEKKHSGEIELFRNKKTKQKAKHEHTDASPCVGLAAGEDKGQKKLSLTGFSVFSKKWFLGGFVEPRDRSHGLSCIVSALDSRKSIQVK